MAKLVWIENGQGKNIGNPSKYFTASCILIRNEHEQAAVEEVRTYFLKKFMLDTRFAACLRDGYTVDGQTIILTGSWTLQRAQMFAHWISIRGSQRRSFSQSFRRLHSSHRHELPEFEFEAFGNQSYRQF